MRIAMVVTPMNKANLRLAAQIGVTDIVGRCPGTPGLPGPPGVPDIGFTTIKAMREHVEAHDLRLSVIEGYLPMQHIVAGNTQRDAQLEQMVALIKEAAANKVEVVCYNTIQILDMTRTSYNVPDRAGALVNGFDLKDLAPEDAGDGTLADPQAKWDNLEWFLKRIVPVCESEGVKLAMHPDDPPIDFPGEARIMSSVAGFQKLVDLVPSEVNGICFCQGCFSEMGVDVPAAIRTLGKHISYVHFRDVNGCVPCFTEAFHDGGQTDMFAAMQAYHDIGFAGPMRPDHVPIMAGEDGEATGYSMQGRLFAVGYMKGLMEAASR